ncbi:hypothetical protein HanRHA438_Chr12g0543651 [Helianthus annuus]|nr:hypothetical protein HanRHA438_Chr12g0543651 [Helianthus annuus]
MQEANAHISNGTTDLEKSQLSLDKVLRESSVQAPNAMHEVSQHAVQNNVEIHLEEPLTVNKDVLTDGQQVNLLEDLFIVLMSLLLDFRG